MLVHACRVLSYFSIPNSKIETAFTPRVADDHCYNYINR